MTTYPAVDIKNGKAVRLRQGAADAETVFYDDPAEAAQHWEACGAEWLHVVDLDGAFQANAANLDCVRAILRSTHLKVQLGGGIRSLSQIEARLKLGVQRVILGTAILENPGLAADAVREFGAQAVICGLDAKDCRIAVRGWVETAEITPLELARRMYDQGVIRVIYTDIARDGMMSGPNFEATEQLVQESGMKVIASGGIASLSDLCRCREIGCEGAITGQAIYTGAIDLKQAIHILNQ